MNLHLQNHVAVVFGAASGIGLAIAKAFLEEGAKTVVVDRDERVRDVAATGYVADVTDYARMQQLAEQVATDVGPVQHVVFAVGAGSGKFGFPFWNLTPAD